MSHLIKDNNNKKYFFYFYSNNISLNIITFTIIKFIRL